MAILWGTDLQINDINYFEVTKHLYFKNTDMGWQDGSVGKVIAMQA